MMRLDWKGIDFSKNRYVVSINAKVIYRFSVSVSDHVLCQVAISLLACVASVPVPRERNWGRAKEFFRIRAARKMRREQKSGRRGVGEGKGGNACPQTPRFLKNAHWFSRLNSFID